MKVVIFIFSILLAISSCTVIEQGVNPKSAPIVLTELLEVSSNSAIIGGVLEYDGHVAGRERGVCWNTSPNPTTDNHVITSGFDGEGAHFYTKLTGIDENTTIYFKAFASNVRGIGYGQELSFTTGTFNTVIPCSPTKNTFVFNHATKKLTYVKTRDWGDFGDYTVIGQPNYGASIDIEFFKAPVSGLYTTVTTNSIYHENECVVIVKSGGTANWTFKANSGDTVYVKKLGVNQYNITFCNLHFTSNGTTYEFDTDGNITVD